MTTRQRIAVLPLMFAAGLLALGACGSGDDGGGVATLDTGGSAAPSASGSVEKEVTDYVECLRKQGIELPDPTVNADGEVTLGRPQNLPDIDRDKFEAAQKACGEPPAGVTTAAEDMLANPEFQDAALKFAQCMREQGVDVPDPDFSKVGSGAGGLFGGMDRDDPKVAAAIEKCQQVFADAGIGRGN